MTAKQDVIEAFAVQSKRELGQDSLQPVSLQPAPSNPERTAEAMEWGCSGFWGPGEDPIGAAMA